ncbi:MAG: RHS repeat-associated core domain-containing protein, partial [Candidatus Moranbacteria bacterium]|nr:RHS repeat-associated core domain-containing protein [Candidatus Moranbacteria bacterium]
MELLSYFYHPDHLGSSSWITDNTGRPIQHLHYLPFGEDWVDQRNSTWNAPYTFSGKEKDVETGYGYFGARYYDSGLSIWLSVDPMSDKYSNMSPYNYCANNPVILVDPDGRTPWPAILYGAGVIMENVIPDYHVRQIGYAIQHPIN